VDDCYQRLQGWGLFEGFAVVQGRVWKDGTPRWEFKYKLHSTKTLNTRGLEPRKLEDREGKVVTDRQRPTVVKARRDCGFNYLLSHKAVSKGSEEKRYTGICARTVPASFPTSTYSTSYTIQREGRKRAQEGRESGRIQGGRLVGRVAISQMKRVTVQA